MRLSREGWRAAMDIPIKARSPYHEISVWQRGAVRMILMLWEIEVDETAFSWGLERERAEGGDRDAGSAAEIAKKTVGR